MTVHFFCIITTIKNRKTAKDLDEIMDVEQTHYMSFYYS